MLVCKVPRRTRQLSLYVWTLSSEFLALCAVSLNGLGVSFFGLYPQLCENGRVVETGGILRSITFGKTSLGIRRMSGNEKDPIKFTSE